MDEYAIENGMTIKDLRSAIDSAMQRYPDHEDLWRKAVAGGQELMSDIRSKLESGEVSLPADKAGADEVAKYFGVRPKPH